MQCSQPILNRRRALLRVYIIYILVGLLACLVASSSSSFDLQGKVSSFLKSLQPALIVGAIFVAAAYGFQSLTGLHISLSMCISVDDAQDDAVLFIPRCFFA